MKNKTDLAKTKELESLFERLREIEKERQQKIKEIEKLKENEELREIDLYAEWLFYGVYLVKEKDGVYLLDNGIKSKRPLPIDANGFCYLLPRNSSKVRWYNVQKANARFKSGNIIEINCRNGILPYAPPVGETIRFELGEHVLIIDLYKQPLAE